MPKGSMETNAQSGLTYTSPVSDQSTMKLKGYVGGGKSSSTKKGSKSSKKGGMSY